MTANRLLVATDGREQSDGALRAGAVMAGQSDVIQVLAAIPPLPATHPEMVLTPNASLIAAVRDDLRAAIEAQVARVLPTGPQTNILIAEGSPAAVVAAVAREIDAWLIVAGLGRHGITDRLFGDETALRIIREATTPVLAVSPSFTAAPKRVVVGVDFSATSLRAAQIAATLAGDAANVFVVHVSPRNHVLRGETIGSMAYETQATASLDRLASQLQSGNRQHVQTVMLRGHPAAELLKYADDVDADLVATGTHGLGFVARLLVGSVASQILRASTRAVLTVPLASE